MMEQASRFISLSGWSGIMAGFYALVASFLAYRWIWIYKRETSNLYNLYNLSRATHNIGIKLFILAVVTLVLALATGILLTVRKSNKNGLQIWTSTTKRMLIHLFVPLVVGGLFCLALYFVHHQFLLISGTTLIFYGLALINASKFTFQDIAYLGYCEVLLGLIGIFFPMHGLLIWTIGFGVLHIIYGILIQRKYH